MDDEGRTYYFDGENTSWDKPSWAAYKDDSGDIYYCHDDGQSRWEVPEEDYLDVEEEAAEEKAGETKGSSAVDQINSVETEDGGISQNQEEAATSTRTTKEESSVVEQEKETSTDPIEVTIAEDSQETRSGSESPPRQASPDAGDEDKVSNDDTPASNDVQIYVWSAFRDDEGRIYYHNEKTGESAWDPPAEGFNPPPAADTVEQETAAPVTVGRWAEYTDDEGRTYYYNEESNDTQWEMPEDFQTASAAATEKEVVPMETEQASEDPQQQKANKDVQISEDSLSDQVDVEMEPAEKSPEIDPAVKRLQDAEEMLGQPDSVLEPDCKKHADIVVAANDGDPQKAMSALITNYRGQTAICGLLGKWLTELNRPADSVREVCRDIIIKTVKDRFSKEVADEILNLSKSEAAFLGGMMDSSEWRKLLIDLTVKHKDSAVLLYCLRGISKRGHHREIAKRINQSEHFAVFNAMVASELSVIGSQAVSTGSDFTSALHLRSLVSDLCRSCTSTGYTFMYSIALLKTLDRLAREEISVVESDGSTSDERFRHAANKWRTLSEEFEAGMTDPSHLHSSGTSSHLLRKRRLEVALSFGDLRVCQKRRLENGASDLNKALAALITRYSMGIQLEEAMLDKLLPQGLNTDTRGVGEIMNRYPLSIKALLGHLFKPGATRVSSPSMRSKCARLVALATEAATNAALDHEKSKTKHSNEDGELPSDASEELGEVALTRMIVEGSKYCEILETTVAFHVFEGSNEAKTNLTTGQKLYALALKCAPVSLGVIMWAKEHTKGRDFSSSASFPTVSSSILSLVRLVAMKRPATRRDALVIASTFMEHSNSEISYKKINSIRENALRLMIVMLTKGEVILVLQTMIKRLKDRSISDLDASLIRYFVFGVIDVVQSPFSPVFVLLMTRLLSVSKVSDALRSSYVSKGNTQRLRNVITLFSKTTDRCDVIANTAADKSASLQSLRQLYGLSG